MDRREAQWESTLSNTRAGPPLSSPIRPSFQQKHPTPTYYIPHYAKIRYPARPQPEQSTQSQPTPTKHRMAHRDPSKNRQEKQTSHPTNEGTPQKKVCYYSLQGEMEIDADIASDLAKYYPQ